MYWFSQLMDRGWSGTYRPPIVAPAHWTVAPPTIGFEPLVAYAYEMGGHTPFMVRTIGAYAKSGGNPRHLHSFLVTLKRDYLFWYWRAATA